MKFTLAACLLGSYAGLAAADVIGCQVDLLNINQKVLGSGCVPFNYFANIHDSITQVSYTVEANDRCGLKFQAGRVIPAGYSVRRVGYC